VRLFEHPDFEQAVLATAEAVGMPEQFVEKDYFVTETLRLIVERLGPKITFKGGTSLSKGWGLIRRFSEDIDLFLDKKAFAPTLSNSGVDKTLEGLVTTIGGHPGLTLLPDESGKLSGKSREDHRPLRARHSPRPKARLRSKTGSSSRKGGQR